MSGEGGGSSSSRLRRSPGGSRQKEPPPGDPGPECKGERSRCRGLPQPSVTLPPGPSEPSPSSAELALSRSLERDGRCLRPLASSWARALCKLLSSLAVSGTAKSKSKTSSAGSRSFEEAMAQENSSIGHLQRPATREPLRPIVLEARARRQRGSPGCLVTPDAGGSGRARAAPSRRWGRRSAGRVPETEGRAGGGRCGKKEVCRKPEARAGLHWETCREDAPCVRACARVCACV